MTVLVDDGSTHSSENESSAVAEGGYTYGGITMEDDMPGREYDIGLDRY